MAVTPEYGFVMPDPTDFVTDLPADFEIFGDAVDAQLKALSPGTTAGDVDYYTSNTAKARLAIGSTGNILTVAGGVPTWAAPAGGATSYALLNAGGTALTGATTITVSGLSGYNKLVAVIQGASTNAASNAISLRLNAATSDYNDRFGLAQSTATYDPGFISGASNNDKIALANMSSSAASTVQGVATIDGANSSGIKIFTHMAGAFGSGNNQSFAAGGGTYTDANVISSISIISSGGNFDAGTIFIYGGN